MQCPTGLVAIQVLPRAYAVSRGMIGDAMGEAVPLIETFKELGAGSASSGGMLELWLVVERGMLYLAHSASRWPVNLARWSV